MRREPQPHTATAMTRREVVQLSMAAFGLISVSRLLLGQPRWLGDLGSAVQETITWQAFLDEALPLAEASVRQGPKSETEYLARLALFVGRAGWEPKAAASQTRPNVGYRQSTLFAKRPFVACRYQVADGGGIRAHDHYGYTAVLKVTRGQARLRTFEFAARDAHSVSLQGTFEVRLAEEKLLSPGDLSVVPMNGPNIHEISDARSNFQFIDLFTFYHPHGHSRRVQIEDRVARDVPGLTYRARWGQLL